MAGTRGGDRVEYQLGTSRLGEQALLIAGQEGQGHSRGLGGRGCCLRPRHRWGLGARRTVRAVPYGTQGGWWLATQQVQVKRACHAPPVDLFLRPCHCPLSIVHCHPSLLFCSYEISGSRVFWVSAREGDQHTQNGVAPLSALLSRRQKNVTSGFPKSLLWSRAVRFFIVYLVCVCVRVQMGWEFNVGLRSTAGLRFWDIQFNNTRIVYELALQTAVAGGYFELLLL